MIQQDERSTTMTERSKNDNKSQKTTQCDQKVNSQNARKREIEYEMNQLKQVGLQSPPRINKSDSSRKTTHSSVTEVR